MKDFDLSQIQQRPDASTCKGLFFRGSTSLYWQDGKLAQKMELHLLRRMSCPGCEVCGPMLDDIAMFAGDGNLDLSEVKQAKLYSPRVTNVSIDRDTGFVDDWDIEFVEVKIPKEGDK